MLTGWTWQTLGFRTDYAQKSPRTLLKTFEVDFDLCNDQLAELNCGFVA